jgi:hypothetical protein
MKQDRYTTIEVYDYHERRVSLPAGFELRVEGRFANLAKKLWSYLIKKGMIVQSFRDDVRVERVVVDNHKLADAIFDRYFNLLDASRDPEMVIVGRDTFRQMMNIRELQDHCGGPLSLGVTGEIKYATGRPGDPPIKRAFNLPVRVVNNMEGFVVLERGR